MIQSFTLSILKWARIQHIWILLDSNQQNFYSFSENNI